MSASFHMFDPLEMKLPDRIESPRLLLRRYQITDASWLFEVLWEERERLRNDFPIRASLETEADTEAFIAHALQQWRSRTALYFAVWDKEQRSYVGEVGLKEIVWSIPRGDIGYFLLKKAEGRGIATEAVSMLVEFAFEVLHMNKLQIRCAVENVRSQRVAERCGFYREGVLRSDGVRPDGQLVDLVYFGMTHADRAAQRRSASKERETP